MKDMRKNIWVRAVDKQDSPQLATLAQRQAERFFRKRHALEPEQVNLLTALLVERVQRASLVAINEHGDVRGAVHPDVWTLPQLSVLYAFLTSRNGIASVLTLPDPVDEDARVVAEALLQELDRFWRAQGTTGDLVRWPTGDVWFSSLLQEYGFRVDSNCMIQRTHTSLPPAPAQPTDITFRATGLHDEEAIMKLFKEELDAQERQGFFARVSPEAVAAFQAKLVRAWSAEGEAEESLRVLVAERDTEIVGMIETTIMQVEPDDEPGFTPPGRYGCLDNVCVRPDARRQGLGSVLSYHAVQYLRSRSLDGLLLWYSVGNRPSERMSEWLGFEPLWTTYQRLNPS